MRLTLPALLLGIGVLVSPGGSTVWTVTPGGPPLQAIIEQASPGDTLKVQAGSYSGPLVVTKPLVLLGTGEPVIQGHGQGSVVKLKAPGIVFRGFRVTGSGNYLDEENSGIEVLARHILVEQNRLDDVLFGIYLRRAHGSIIRNNEITGKMLDLPRRGDLIRVWYSDSVLVENNTLRLGRDVVLWYSNHLTVRYNRISGGRYGIHFMYCDDANIYENQLTENSVGAFLMYSRRLHFYRNFMASNRGGSGFGIGMKDLDDARIIDNLFIDNRVGIFIDNSPREIESRCTLKGNVIAYNDYGVLLLPNVRRNLFEDNTFLENEEQVAIDGGGRLVNIRWNQNFWSDYTGLDLNGDGFGDIPYASQRFFESLMDRHPILRLLLYSPAVQALNFAAKAVPLVQPDPKLVDSLPRVKMVIPVGVPAPPKHKDPTLSILSALLLGVSIGFTFLGRSRKGRFGSIPKNPSHKEAALPMSERPLVQIKHLNKRFGSLQAVKDVSFEVRPGESIALWGPNGAGKTTVLRCILGLYPFEGEIYIDGLSVREHPKDVRQKIGFVPQELGLYDEMTVEETVTFFANLRKVSQSRALECLCAMGLEEHREKVVKTLSGGMKQRLALAVALLSDPPLLLFDEPTSNLDRAVRESFFELLNDLRAQGKTLIFTSHRFEEVRVLADRVLVLEQGHLVADAPPLEAASTLGWKTKLRLYPAPADLARAYSHLQAQGFDVQQNGSALWVWVLPTEKMAPIQALVDAGIPIQDFELEEEGGRS